MRSKVRKWKPTILACATVAIVLATLTFAATTNKTRRFADGEKVSVSGPILSRDGDLIRVRDKKSDGLILIRINDTTKIERRKRKFPFYRHTDMDVTALLHGLNIEAEGV